MDPLDKRIMELNFGMLPVKGINVIPSNSPFRGVKFRQSGVLTIDPSTHGDIAWNLASEAIERPHHKVAVPFKGYVAYYTHGN
jgi:hypothetical protein